jgi:hypothetical protein
VTSLDREYDINLLAQGLGVAGEGRPPVSAILDHCREKIAGWISSAKGLTGIDQLESIVRGNLRLVIEEVWSEEDLQRLIRKYVALREFAFAHLADELDNGTFGALYERRHIDGRSRDRYVAFIDCRTQEKAARRVFTRWHEIAHALTCYRQLQLPLNRSRIKGSPTERMMDLIAGELNFYSPLFRPVLNVELKRSGNLTFAGVERIRDEFHPAASFQSTLNACVRTAPFAAAVVEASLEHKNCEIQAMNPSQGVLIDLPPVPKALRLTSVAPNEDGRSLGLHLKLRVPTNSVIATVFNGSEEFSAARTAIEDLGDWTHSNSPALAHCVVQIEARKLGDLVLALIQAA